MAKNVTSSSSSSSSKSPNSPNSAINQKQRELDQKLKDQTNPSNSSGVAQNGESDPIELPSMRMLHEYGSTGLTRFGGFIYEEWLKELQGKRGALIYREMRDNDTIIGAFLYAIEMIIRKIKWKTNSASDSPADVAAKDFVDSCFNGMNISWNDTVSEILTFLPYGWCYMELVYKKRDDSSNPNPVYNDGRIGWKKWGIRSQETLWKWHFDDRDDSILGMEQIAPPDYINRFIPMEKALLFRTKSNKNNPEGRSLLRNAYRAWYFKKNIEEVEAIGIERDLAGLPVMWLPPEVMAGGMSGATADQVEAYNAYKKIVINIKRDEQEGMLMPLVYDDKGNKMYDIQLLSSGATRRQFDTNQIIQRYEQRIAMTVLADWLTLGHEKTGSYALSTNKTTMFHMSLESILDIISEVVNTNAITKLIKLNAFTGLTGYPTLGYEPIEKANLKEIGDFLKNVCEVAGITLGDLETENYLRDCADLPKVTTPAKDLIPPTPPTPPTPPKATTATSEKPTSAEATASTNKPKAPPPSNSSGVAPSAPTPPQQRLMR